jgi:hypothetical protein
VPMQTTVTWAVQRWNEAQGMEIREEGRGY